MNIPEQIDGIISNRKKKIAYIDSTLERIEKCWECVNSFESMQNKLVNGDVPLFDETISGKIRNVQTEEFKTAYNEYKASLNDLKNRFNRDKLHISFVGKAGAGKSLVMQKISGLHGTVIPSADGSDCTGAKSIVTNDENASKVHAKITFYNQLEMVGIVNNYYHAIFDTNNELIYSIEDIKKINTKELREKINIGQADKTAKFAQLEKYIEHIEEFKNNLGKTIDVEETEIESYVAQYNSQNMCEKYYKYLGVKKANIICNFQCEEAGKIVLVDTIGLGDTSIGVEDKMLYTIEKDSDAIVLMNRPDSLRPGIRQEEVDVITKIANRVNPEYSQELLFWIINKVSSGKGENTACIQDIVNDIRKNKYPIADVLEVDCNDENEVRENLLIPILNRLSDRIEVVDNMLVKNLNDKSDDLYGKFSKIRNAVDKVFKSSANNDIKRDLLPQIVDVMDKGLLNNIREKTYPNNDDYPNSYGGNIRHLPCEPLQKATAEKLKNIIKAIPDDKEIKELLLRGRINKHNAFEKCTDMIRMKIIDDFLELDNTLDEVVNDMKKDIVHIFADEDKGKFGRLVEFNEEKISPNDWINSFLEKVEAESQYPLIAKALTAFRDFNVSVKGFLIFEVRDQLDPIDISLSKSTPTIYAEQGEKEKLIEELKDLLKHYIVEIHNKIRIKLRELYSVPNRAMFAAIKDLYDRCAYDSMNDILGIEEEWRQLYEDWIHIIWREEYNKKMSVQNIAEEWNDTVSAFRENSDKDLFLVQMGR